VFCFIDETHSRVCVCVLQEYRHLRLLVVDPHCLQD
jgi:hypothetical protein